MAGAGEWALRGALRACPPPGVRVPAGAPGQRLPLWSGSSPAHVLLYTPGRHRPRPWTDDPSKPARLADAVFILFYFIFKRWLFQLGAFSGRVWVEPKRWFSCAASWEA